MFKAFCPEQHTKSYFLFICSPLTLNFWTRTLNPRNKGRGTQGVKTVTRIFAFIPAKIRVQIN